MNKQQRKSRGGPPSAATLISKTIAVPHEHRPLRLPTFPNVERTAVMQYTITGTTSIFGTTVVPVMLVRSPVAPLWAHRSFDSGKGSVYFAQDTGGNLFPGDVSPFPESWADEFHTYGAGGAMVHHYPLGVHSGRDFVHGCSAGAGHNICELYTNTSGTAGNAVLILDYEVWDGNNFANRTISQGSLTIPGASSIYISFDLPDVNDLWWRPVAVRSGITSTANIAFTRYHCGVSSINVSSVVTIFTTGGGALMNAHACPTASMTTVVFSPVVVAPEIRNSYVPYTSVRANAAAVLFTNVTKVLDKEGTASAFRIPANTTTGGYTMWQPAGYSTLMTNVVSRERYFGAMEKGLYAYTLPDASAEALRTCVDFDMVPYQTGTQSTNHDCKCVFHLDGFDYANIIIFSDLADGDSTLAYTLDAHLEFRSSSSLFQLGFSTTPLETYHLAQMALAKQGCFYENPLHLSMIARLIGSAVTTLAPIVRPYVYSAARAAGQQLLSMAASKLSGRMNQAGLAQTRAPRNAQPPPKKRAQTQRRPRGRRAR